jgi:hypothetical protein
MEEILDVEADRSAIAADLSKTVASHTARCGKELHELSQAQDRLFLRLEEIQKSELHAF